MFLFLAFFYELIYVSSSIYADSVHRYQIKYAEEGVVSEILSNSKRRISQKDYRYKGGDKELVREINYTYTKQSFAAKLKQNNVSVTTGIYKTPTGWESFLIDKENMEEGQELIYAKIHYDNDGYELKREFFNSKTKKIKNRKGVFSIQYKYNKKKERLEESFFAEDGNSVNDVYGIHRKIIKRDKLGNIILQANFNTNNQLTDDEYGIAQYIYQYDYNCIRKRHITCYSLIENKDRNGYLVEKEYIIDQFTKEAQKAVVARVKYTYDSNGYKTMEAFYDSNGKLREIDYVRIHEGDVAGHLEDGGVVYEGTTPYKVAIIKTKYDPMGNLLYVETFNKQEKPVGDKENGIAKKEYTYNQNCLKAPRRIYNCFESETSYNAEGKLKNEFNYAKAIYHYNPNGELVSRRLYSEDGKEVQDKRTNKIVLSKSEYSSDNFLIKETFVDSNGNLAYEKPDIPVSIRTYTYDEFGRNILIQLYNEKSELIGIIKNKYDKQDNKLSVNYYDGAWNLLKGITYKYQNNWKVLQTNTNKDKLPSEDHNGICYAKYQYDKNCIKFKENPQECYSSIEYYQCDDKLKNSQPIPIPKELKVFQNFIEQEAPLTASGIAGYKMEYDKKGNVISQETFNQERKLASPISKNIEPAKISFLYNSNGEVESILKFSSSMSIIEKQILEESRLLVYEQYNEEGELTSSEYNIYLQNPKGVKHKLIHIIMDQYHNIESIFFEPG